MTRLNGLTLFTVGIGVLFLPSDLVAQDLEITIQKDGKTIVVPSGAVPRPPSGRTAPSQPKPPGTKPAPPKAGAKKKATKPGDKKKKDAPATTIKRPTKPRAPANPEGLEVMPDPAGKITFNLRGHPWPDVLEWLAKVSALNLDWQELPKDYLNLVTRRSYTVEEARDIINRHLLNRGYTMLLDGEVLTVVNISKLNPAMVPRVQPEDLKKRASHEFVKVAFKLDWMLAATAVEEWKPLLSKNGKLTQLASINRVEAIDAVINLREIHKMLTENQKDNGDGKGHIVKEFELEHRDVMEVVGKLEVFLGLFPVLRRQVVEQ